MVIEDLMVFTKDQARSCVETARPGASFCYAIGYLPILCSPDRPAAFKRFGKPEKIAEMADYMRRAGTTPHFKNGELRHGDGLSLGVLTQVKTKNFVYQYFFTRK